MKTLKATMRENKRYLLVRGENLKENIEKAILEFVGILGMSKTGLSFIKAITHSDSHTHREEAKHREALKREAENEKAIICINREAINEVRASFAVFPEKIEVKKVSGTLKGLRGK